jgi:hypothetical protein
MDWLGCLGLFAMDMQCGRWSVWHFTGVVKKKSEYSTWHFSGRLKPAFQLKPVGCKQLVVKKKYLCKNDAESSAPLYARRLGRIKIS